ncbi:MAG TPA: acyltransferase [Acidobacteriaceae bacterium]|nr:acyltransferase [Acidobacteriaceae bacterium]
MKRITQLDGLRALAVSAVVICHRGWFEFGGYGVDVFFVLSGYLITGILLNGKGEPGLFAHFYRRRIQRIFPSYFLCLFWVALFAWSHWGHVIAWYVLFAGNVEVALHTASRHGPWGVYWSLAVEEHFYFLWPFLVLRLSRRALARCLVLIVVLSPLARALGQHFVSDPWIIYYLTPFRLDGLALGSLLAVLCSSPVWVARMRRWSIPVAFGAFGLLLSSQYLFPSVAALSSMTISGVVAGSAALIYILIYNQLPWLTALLQTRVLRGLGTISFTLYLIQEPMSHAVQYLAARWHYTHGLRAAVASIVLAVAYATASWLWMEKPILRRKWGGPPERAIVSTPAA